ncbi:FAD dependent oxidoreductase [Nitzschia inconspicua]|uniref:FAD dependent oxidoreductase n=1 Tax=Nitzschia inconspicua TaxID=303405 RepID=A0A9K3LBY2_9STRA|nr:FAD dependent oxidoreductase [Nitzschia inconspicua]
MMIYQQGYTKRIASAISSSRLLFPFHPHHSLFRNRVSFFSSVSSSPLDSLPDHATVVIIGGGIIGNSVAYHLGKLGVQDVVLLERDRLTSGTTWHAAGLMTTFGSMSSQSMDMRLYTRELYQTILPEETGLETGMMDVGFIELAAENPNNPKEAMDRWHYLRRVAAFNRLCGVNVTEITPDEVKKRFPLFQTDGILAGFYVPEDGRVNPTDATMAFSKGARQNGVRIVEGITVKDVVTTNPVATGLPRAVQGVRVVATSSTDERGSEQTSEKEISATVVVNTAGMWARQLGELSGVTLPNQAAEHYYLITDPIPGLDPRWPVVEDPSRCIYVRPEGNGLLVGFFEWEGAPWNAHEIPDTFSFGQIEPDWDRMEPYLIAAMERLVPEIQDVGIKTFFCGPESFTPDNSPMVGPAPTLKNYYVAAGLNSIGILTGGGIGKTLAQWIKNDGISPSDTDVTGIHVNRFHKYQSNRGYREKIVSEALGNTYLLHYPDHQPRTCRGSRKSVLHESLTKNHASFRDVSGWESPAWFAASDNDLKGDKTFGRPHYFSFWEAEHRGCRDNVALFDMSFMSKILVQGYDAGKFLNWLSTANVDGPVHQITYTQWLNENGHLEADLTVTKLSETEFLVVATDTMHHHVMQHMTSRLSRDWHVTLSDVTSSYTQINVQGPRSRDLLQRLTSRDLDDTFPFRRAEEIDIGDLARVLCVRITYVGELGYELFIPTDQAQYVYDQIVENGKEFGLVHAGLKALGSLRLEKGYRDYGHDIDNTDTILEAGLSFTIDWDKAGGFIGMEHVQAQQDRFKSLGGRPRRMANVFVSLSEVDPLLYHGEILWRNGERISDLRAGSYGHTVGGGVGLTMLQSPDGTTPITKSWIKDATWELEIADKFIPCQVALSPFYDPKNERIK